MRSEETEGAHQQEGHEPEGVIQKGVLVLAVMRGVRQVPHELSIGIGVTCLAGFNHVGSAQSRFGIGDGENVV